LIENFPTKGQRLLGIFKEKYAEEMSFPTVFFGDPRDNDIVEIFHYQKITQWELMQYSSDFSYHTSNLFFKML